MALDVNLVDLNNLITGNIPKTTLSGRIFLGVIGNKLPAKDAKAFIYARGFNKIDDPKPSQLKQTIQQVCKLTEEEAEEAIQETLQTILEYDWHEVYDKVYEARQGFHTGCTSKDLDEIAHACYEKSLADAKQECLADVKHECFSYINTLDERNLKHDLEREAKRCECSRPNMDKMIDQVKVDCSRPNIDEIIDKFMTEQKSKVITELSCKVNDIDVVMRKVKCEPCGRFSTYEVKPKEPKS